VNANAFKAENQARSNERKAFANREGAKATAEGEKGKEVNKDRIEAQGEANKITNAARISVKKNAKIKVNAAKALVNGNAQIKSNAANATKLGANANARGAKALVNKNAQIKVNAAKANKTAVEGVARAEQGSFNNRMTIKRNSLKIALEKLNLTEAEKNGYIAKVTINGSINGILTEAKVVDKKRFNNKLLIAKKQGNLNTIKKLQKIQQNKIEAATNAMKKKKELLNKRKKNTNRPGGGGPPPGPGGGTNTQTNSTKVNGGGTQTNNNNTKTKLARARWKLAGKNAVQGVKTKIQAKKLIERATNRVKNKKEIEKVYNGLMNELEEKVKKLEKNAKSGNANKTMVGNLTKQVNNLTEQLKSKELFVGEKQKDIEALMIVLSNIARNLGGPLPRTVYDIQPKILKLKKRVSNAIQDRNQAVKIGENQAVKIGVVRSERRRDEINKILENTNLNNTKKKEFLQKYTTGNSRYKTTKQLREELRGVENKNKNDKNKPKTLSNYTFTTPRAKANAAVMIQKTVRGRQNRKKVAKMRANKEKPVWVNPLSSQEQQPKPNTTVNNKPNNKKNLEIRKEEVRNIARKGMGKFGAIGIGKWGIAISKATSNDINTLKKKLLEKRAYHNQIEKMNNLGKKTKHLREVWNLNINVEETKKLVEANREELKKKMERERNKREVDRQKAKNNAVREFKKKREAAKEKIQAMNLNETNKTALLEKINNTGTTTLLRNVLKNADTKQTSKRLEKVKTQKANKKAAEAAEKAKRNIEIAEKRAAKAAKEAGEKAARAAAKAAKEAKEAGEKAAKEAEEKAAKEAAEKAKVERPMRKKVKRDIETNIRLNAKTKAALTKRISNGNNINAVKNGLSKERKKANKERTKAAVMIQKTVRGRQNRQKVAKMRANEKEGVARAQSNLKASKERNAQQQRKNQAARVIRGYNINNGNKNKFINNLKTTKTQQNIKIIQERAKTIHNAAVTNKKMAAKAAKKAEAQARKEKERQEAEARTRKLKANKQAAEAALNAEKQKAREAIAGYTLYDWQAKGFLTKIKAAKKSDQLQKIQREAKGIHNKTVKNRAANAAKKAKANANAVAKAKANANAAAKAKARERELAKLRNSKTSQLPSGTRPSKTRSGKII